MLKLKSLNPAQARFVAKIALAARLQRDDLLGHVAINGLVEPRSAAREPSTVLLAPELQRAGQTAPLATLRAVITALPSGGRAELYALKCLGQGDLAGRQWHQAIAQAARLGDETITAMLIEDPDLHDHLAKGLYEARLAGA